MTVRDTTKNEIRKMLGIRPQAAQPNDCVYEGDYQMEGYLQFEYSENVGEWLDSRNPPVETVLQCPLSGAEVMGDRWRYPYLSSGQVIWWHCPGCQGWHVLRIELNPHIEVNL